MKKIFFKTGYLGLGAIEQLAYDIICNLSKEYKVILAIENETNNTLVEKLPKNIEYFYLKDKKFINKMKKLRENKRNIINRLKYNFLLTYEKRVCYRKINKWLEKNGDVDLFIDYDGMSTKYAEKINISKKIVWQHTSIDLNINLVRLEKRLNKYDKVILICEDMKKDYIKKFPKLKEKFTREYNFLDLERIKLLTKDISELSSRDKEMQKEKYCIAVARLDEPKDFETLLKAFSLLDKKGINEKLYIIGDGELKEKIEKQIEDLNLQNKVFLIGKKHNPYTWIKNASLFLHSSKREGFPAVLLEGLACDKVVVSSDCKTGPREILNNGLAGELYKVGDYISLNNIIENLLKNKNKRDEYLREGEKQILKFEKERILQEYGILIKEILK